MSNQFVKYCKVCRQDTVHFQPSTSHVLHLLLSIVTFGVWLIVWVLIGMNNASQAQCSKCGSLQGVLGTTRKSRTAAAPPSESKAKREEIRCPACAEDIKAEAKVCKHCGYKLKED
ncbi:zinc ribbon domain-containing protein [Thioalkalivibrio sp. ALE9]|uniref:zinc ribbon domain-containing protein n=1 Tax=Thioalkalivibrio sp. ALE9 TaxID=1158169 RepID=UPI00037739BA|nr:zinc ribbon domain-containing protein [Thioalkalivibrio sp. ALE9]